MIWQALFHLAIAIGFAVSVFQTLKTGVTFFGTRDQNSGKFWGVVFVLSLVAIGNGLLAARAML